MPAVQLDGVNLHYEVDGDPGRPALVVLHGGLGFDHHLYRRSFAPLVDDHHLVFPDLRGNGGSFPADLATVTMAQLADDVVALADHLGRDRFAVLGHSYGGFVAQELALRHGDRLDGLVLVDTTPGQLGASETEEETEQGPPPPREVLELMASMPPTDEALAAGMAQMLPAYFHRPERIDIAGLDEGTVFRAAVMVRGFEVLGGWSSVDRLGSVVPPVLLLVGRHDLFTSWPQSYRIARHLPGDPTVVVFEESGHFPWIEEPERFFAVLRSWLDAPGTEQAAH
jgi:proline iminopeptidase